MPKRKPFTIEEGWPKITREVRPLTEIHPYPKNPRTHPPAQIALLAALLKRYGPDQDIVVDGDDGMILKGHGRRLGAIAAGMKEFPVTIRHGLSEPDKIALRISDNQTALMSGWDQELIRSEIASFKHDGGDVSLLGFGDAQLVQFTTTPAPPSEFATVGENLPTSFQCPRCGHAWSGAAKPPPKPAKPAKKNGKK